MVTPTGESKSEGDAILKVYIDGSSQPEELKITVRRPKIAALQPPRLTAQRITWGLLYLTNVRGMQLWRIYDQFNKPLPEVNVDESVYWGPPSSPKVPVTLQGQGTTDRTGMFEDFWSVQIANTWGHVEWQQTIII